MKHFKIIIKGDVQGSVEALISTLCSIENEEVKVQCINSGVGAINENDVSLAYASGAVIIAFNVKTDYKANVIADKNKVEIKNYKIIYEAVDYISEEIHKLLTPKYKEVITGHAEIRMIFKSSKVGSIAGSYILDGKIIRGAKARVIRKGKVMFETSIQTIQREKNEVKEINSGFECGIVLSDNADIQESDVIEDYTLERIN